MSINLADLVAPGHTAIVTQELQGAVSGPTGACGCSPKRPAGKPCQTSVSC
jgi:hypothetical protein